MSNVNLMEALVLVSKQNLEYRKVPIPSPEKGQILIKTKYAGICGSDIHAFNGLQPDLSYPRIMGHELVGEVVVGNGTDPSLIGAHVVVDPSFRCGVCDNCRSGKENISNNLRVLGVHCDGGFAHYFVCDENMAHRLPDGLSYETAIFCEPLSIAVHAARKIRQPACDSILIVGAGPIGLALLLVLKQEQLCRKCVVIDMYENRLDVAKKIGADLVVKAKHLPVDFRNAILGASGKPMDVIFDTVSNGASVQYDEQLVKSGGQVIIVGLANSQTAFHLLSTLKKELTINGTRMTTHQNFAHALQLLSRVDPYFISCIVSDVFPFLEAIEAFDFVRHHPDKGIKTILSFD
ncbi:MAG: alcohol dehydrogenase catalytic domain-containing protein [Spirochaetaceae bacterium]|nr:alcohol dehydrogenase catalytic domain-containing protein [Spirochaetaceae bacterium]